ncbi:MAG: helix-turn-helix domain-containing protein [Acidimicrobiia bacterium]|nr:helix-turn-helix domain-containing protein [Acidimicrobiia bacterium]
MREENLVAARMLIFDSEEPLRGERMVWWLTQQGTEWIGRERRTRIPAAVTVRHENATAEVVLDLVGPEGLLATDLTITIEDRQAKRNDLPASRWSIQAGQGRRHPPDAVVNLGGVETRSRSSGTLLGVSRQSVNEALGEMRDQGVVETSFRRITVLDLEALRAVADENGH